MVVLAARSTSLNTTPIPFVSAAVSVLGTTNCVRVTLLPIGANSRSGENGANAVEYVGLTSVNSTRSGSASEAPASSSSSPETSNPVPGVANRAPRLRKLFSGMNEGAERWSGTPSQLICRRPVAAGGLPPLSAPSALRN